MNWNIVRDFLICVPATIFFAILLKVPRKAILMGAILGGTGYAVYEWTSPVMGSAIAGYFIGTLLMAVCSEILARFMKMPATIFIIPAIIPLVPGIGLYNTMMYLVHGQNEKAGQTGVSTIMAIVAMAMALVLTAILTNAVTFMMKVVKRKL
jgi:uncharacterized membrane protein YjjB (DUF3815 family)